MEVFKKFKENILKHIEKPKKIENIHLKDITPKYLDALIHKSNLTNLTTKDLLNNKDLLNKIKKFNINNAEHFIKNIERVYEQICRMLIYKLSDHYKIYKSDNNPLKDFISEICLIYLNNDLIAKKKLLFINKRFKYLDNKEESILIKNIINNVINLINYKDEICILLFPSYDSIINQNNMIPIIDNLNILNNKEINKKINIDILNMTLEENHIFSSIFCENYRNNNNFKKVINIPPLIKYNYSNSPFPIPLFTIPGIYCDGVYDLFHYGHSRLLLQAKELFPYVKLIVGVTSDKDTLYYKGITAMNAKDRAESIRHCKYVDSVISNCPWTLNEEYLKLHNIWYVVHDDEPYVVKKIKEDDEPNNKKIKIEESISSDCYLFLKDSMRFVPSNRTPGISTSGLIRRLLVNYENFLERNVNRGMTAKELNISPLKFNFIKLKNLFNEKIVDVKKDLKVLKIECVGAMNLWEEYKDLLRIKFLRVLEDIWTFDDDDDIW